MLFLPRLHRLLRYINKTSYKKCRCYSETKFVTSITDKLKTGPDLKDFITGSSEPILIERPHIPYLPENVQYASKRKVFFDVYGCQMNLNDTEIVWSILKKEGFEKTVVEEEADIFLVMTCAIREGAESKIWHRLDHLRGFKRRAMAKNKNKEVKIVTKFTPIGRSNSIWCIVNDTKHRYLISMMYRFNRLFLLVAGPDSYRDLPRLLALTENGQTAVNVILSVDETYADVVPVRLNQDSVSAFIVSAVEPEMRIRFTAAHPKDFPDESGSTATLQRMRRGYSREAYLDLVHHVRDTIPGVGLSTDMICGFCGETDEEFEQTLSLMQIQARHSRMVALYRTKCQQLNEAEIGNTHLVLVEGTQKKTGQILARNELYIKVVFDQTEVPIGGEFQSCLGSEKGVYVIGGENRGIVKKRVEKGDYVAVKIVGAKSSVLSGVPLYHTSLSEFYRDRGWVCDTSEVSFIRINKSVEN
ncbi:CDK5 regulatory subunit-associated protein 1 [Operophtera brumata]|uniref:CDK5 regulatory subunit-associated protein 1 n=1 Tax=Operophtera brumata TaxID=104452 RepID=A0A0L7L5H0_OPEBR|nr:CDK5 regulatory subunit-associated protein 1 [Operophtera brumata]